MFNGDIVLSVAANRVRNGGGARNGCLVTNVNAPITATSNANVSKTGAASCSSILGVIALGDASQQAAMKNGGITKIHHVDFNSFSILGIYAKFTTTVYGE